MSSLAAASADGFYHPPDWDPRAESRAAHASRKAGDTAAWKAHPLRQRAKKLDQGILTIRFEMPFNVRCLGCDNQIAKGVRFDAEKKCVGRYLSTKIWSFRMLCHAERDGDWRCDRRRNPHWIEVHTDPKNCEYVVVEGARRVDGIGGSASERGVESTLDPEEVARRAADPFYKLETGTASTADQMASQEAKRASRSRGKWLDDLTALRDEDWFDDYETNRLMRRAHRTARHGDFLEGARREAVGIRVALADEHDDDVAAAQAAPLRGKRRRSDAAFGEASLRLMSGSIFGDAPARPASKAASKAAGKAAATKGGGSRAALVPRQRGSKDSKERLGDADRLRLLQLKKARGMAISAVPAEPPPPKRAAPATSAARGARRESGREPPAPGLKSPPQAAAAPLVAYSDSESDS